jgi:hypothetical protein
MYICVTIIANCLVLKNKRKIVHIILHLLAWVLVFIGPVGLILYQYNLDYKVLLTIFIFLSVLILGFYINYSFFIPALLFRKKFFKYFLATSLLIGAIVLLNVIFFSRYRGEMIGNSLTIIETRKQPVELRPPPLKQHPPDRREAIAIQPNFGKRKPLPFVISPLFTPIFGLILIVFGIAIRTTQMWFAEDRRNKEIIAEQLKTELAFLKNQISPHFFFNTLNNIYALTESDPDKAKEITYKLSKLMRYLIYDSDKNRFVSLAMEIAFLNNYIDLMKGRLPESVKVEFNFETEKDKVLIPPLLFITFIENAFKHGISSNGESYVVIDLKNIAGKIVFTIKNSLQSAPSFEKGAGGLGLVNIKRRLELLFDKSEYSLLIDNDNKEFIVELIMPAYEN